MCSCLYLYRLNFQIHYLICHRCRLYRETVKGICSLRIKCQVFHKACYKICQAVKRPGDVEDKISRYLCKIINNFKTLWWNDKFIMVPKFFHIIIVWEVAKEHTKKGQEVWNCLDILICYGNYWILEELPVAPNTGIL